ncbi:uncharacterized protein N7498_008034 [Penicillium cinerascens]|uniref:Extracellular protein n=1 Tax=Penicillium cinerascens TaxID=70096 RepID=A0A9W9JHS2_9EURO|nr:uncharacterized protein N7498_008034 [Penicillium cinerascens]KAJ5194596.1 hypothetical protein N7498_008034 [Penicillium cinerascens]
MKGVAFIAGLLATGATAHMQMSKPYPIRSPLNKDAKGQKDYSYTNPLSSSGSDYPCKGFANDEFDSQATYQPGGQYEMELEGSATHGGGSCQLSLTYDRGKTFKVIESMLGTCPIPKKYSFTVPSDAPSGEAMLAWTWFNKIGNREMYMNCAFVTIGGDDSKGTEVPAVAAAPAHPKAEGKKVNHMQQMEHPHEVVSHHPMGHAAHPNKEHAAHHPMGHAAHPNMDHAAHPNMEQRDISWMETHSMATAFDSLPPIFVANVNQEGKCVTIEGEPVNFPEPGDNVIGQASGKGYKCAGNAPFLGSSDSGSPDSSSSDSGSSDSSSSDPSSKSTNDTKDSESTKDSSAIPADNKKANATRSEKSDPAMSKIASAFGTPSADPRVVTEASTSNAFSSYVGLWACHDNEIMCSPDGWSWAMCSNGRPIYMGSVAAGTSCRFGQMVAAGAPL